MLSALVISLIGVACQRQSQRPAVDPAPEIEAALQVNPQPAAVGPTELEVSLKDEDGQPVEGAVISVRGDMSHAGMVPVFGEAEEAEPGHYLVPFEWSMGGEWIVTLMIELVDGREIERKFDLSVASGG